MESRLRTSRRPRHRQGSARVLVRGRGPGRRASACIASSSPLVYGVDMATGNRLIRGYSNVFRVLIWLVVIAYLGQAVLAGQFLSGTYAALRLHQTGGTASDLILFLAVVIGALLQIGRASCRDRGEMAEGAG